jgi:hypothetical protein
VVPAVLPNTGGDSTDTNASIAWPFVLLAGAFLLLSGGMGLATARISRD